LPGGAGTLEEISEAFSWARVGDNASPCAFYNVNHYYDAWPPFTITWWRKVFLTAADRSKLLFTADLTELGHFIDSYTPPRLRTYPKQGRA
ncbi:LOG family protein, partial [Lacticaseibacillus camelliae]|uniref:LOG family protein n=1 Tax=Lacticaseibacillus camelliae TaxID=381742 RepID=UPI000B2AA5E6